MISLIPTVKFTNYEPPRTTVLKQINHEKFTLTLLKPNFIKLEIHEEQTIEPDDIREIAAGYEQLAGDNEYVVAFYGYDFATVTREAMEVAVKEFSNPKRKKSAVITNNLAHIILIRLYILWYKPVSQFRMFKSEEAAFEWLEE